MTLRAVNFVFLILAGWCLENGRAAAQPETPESPEDPEGAVSEEAYRRLVTDAVGLSNAGRFQEALALFSRAHELRPSARTFRGIGLVRFELGDYAQAVPALRQALSDQRRPLDEEAQTEVRQALERATAFVARVELAVTPADATITDNGRSLLLDDGVLLFNPGRHQVTFEHPDHPSQTRVWVLEGGERRRVTLSLLPATPTRRRTPTPAARTPLADDIPIAVRSAQEELRLRAERLDDPPTETATIPDNCFAPCDTALPGGRYRVGIARGLEPPIDVGLLELTEPVEITLAYDDRDGLRAAGWAIFAASIAVPVLLWSLIGPVDGTGAGVLGALGGVSFVVAFPTSMVLVGLNNGATVRVAPLEVVP